MRPLHDGFESCSVRRQRRANVWDSKRGCRCTWPPPCGARRVAHAAPAMRFADLHAMRCQQTGGMPPCSSSPASSQRHLHAQAARGTRRCRRRAWAAAALAARRPPPSHQALPRPRPLPLPPAPCPMKPKMLFWPFAGAAAFLPRPRPASSGEERSVQLAGRCRETERRQRCCSRKQPTFPRRPRTLASGRGAVLIRGRRQRRRFLGLRQGATRGATDGTSPR